MPQQIKSRQGTGVASSAEVLSLKERVAFPERFVDSIVAGEFLSVTPRRVLDMARAGSLPAHPLGDGKRRVWRFRLSELESTLCQIEANFSAQSERRTFRSRRSSGTETGR